MTNEVNTVPPKPGIKLSKKDAGYVAKGPFGCLNCSWYEGTKSKSSTGNCDVVGGQVSGGGCCDFWNDQSAPKDAGKKRTEYVYVTGADYTCAQCKFYDAGSRTCTPVNGDIAPGASCNKWMPISGGRMTESYSLNLGPDLLLSPSIRAAVQDGIKEAASASIFNVPGGRPPKTPAADLIRLNAPCATCGHSYNVHSVEGEGKKCVHCAVKGSVHTYHESTEFVQHTVNAPDKGTMRESQATYSTDNLFTEEEQAMIRLAESIFPSPDVAYNHTSSQDDQKRKAIHARASLYNSHALAAHRSSSQAFSTGDAADHEVASQHHQMAADAASNAQQLHSKGSQDHKDYATAHAYHSSQATAHKNAAKASTSGNRVRHPMMASSY